MDKVLIVCYYWPPAGGPGVQRWLKFATYLPESNMEPIVFVPENPSYPLTDASLVKETPEGIRVIKQRIFEPYGWASLFSKKKIKRISSGVIQKRQEQSLLERLLLWVRGNFFIPDARKYWVKPSVKALVKIIQEEGIRTVITTGPPHSVHLIGFQLKQKLPIQWLADFRDPWTSIGYHKKLKLTKRSQHKHKTLEKQVLNSADKLVVTSTKTKQEFEGLTTVPIEVITNGYDGEFISTKLDESFTVSHIGSLLTDRNPKTLWKVLADLCNENPEFKATLKIQLAGVVGDGVRESIAKQGLVASVSFLGYVSHDKVIALQRKSQLLVLLEIDAEETQGIIPGKLFEYLHAHRPILAVGPKDWEVANILKETKAGHSVLHDDYNSLKNVLLDAFKAYQDDGLHSRASGIEQYSRKALTKKLTEFIRWESSKNKR